MRKARLGIVVASILVISGVAIRWPKKNADAVYLVAVRYSLQGDFRENAPKTKRVIFLRLNGQDPTPRFLSAVQIPMTDVRPGSRAKGIQNLKSGDQARDSLTGEKGEYLNFSAIRWNYPVQKTYDPMMGEASVGFKSTIVIEGSGPCEAYSDYELSRKNGRWEVIDHAGSVAM